MSSRDKQEIEEIRAIPGIGLKTARALHAAGYRWTPAQLMAGNEDYGNLSTIEQRGFSAGWRAACEYRGAGQAAKGSDVAGFAAEVKQLCKDFSDLRDRPYMGDVTSAIDSLLQLFLEGGQ